MRYVEHGINRYNLSSITQRPLRNTFNQVIMCLKQAKSSMEEQTIKKSFIIHLCANGMII